MIECIYVSTNKKSPQLERKNVRLDVGNGIVGDRNYGKSIYPGQNITLVEAEEIELFCRTHGRSIDLSITRRNVVTRGVRLNSLVGKEFTIGNVRLKGIELCEPCADLGKNLSSEALSIAKVVKYWVKRGGLRADIIVGGEIQVGLTIEGDSFQ
jgi:MOSC domain-containing protein YiiM